MQFFNKIFFLLLLSVSIYASQKTNVLIIHSYSQEYDWTKNQHNSFVSTLNQSYENFYFNTEYLDSKRLEMTPQYEYEFIKYLKLKYADWNPDLIYVTDDNALKLVFENHKDLFKNKKQIPVFFSGVNNLDMDKILPKDFFAGVYELKEIKPNIELIKQFSPQTRDISFIGDDSNTYHSIKKELESQQKNFDNIRFNYINSKYISEILKKLPKSPKSFVLLTTIGHLKDEDNNNLFRR